MEAVGVPGRVDAEGALADEGEELGDLGNVAEIGLDPVKGGCEGPALLVEDPVSVSKGVDDRDGEPGSSDPHEVEPRDSVVALQQDERRDVLGRRPEAADHRQAANPDPLLNRRMG